MGQTQTSATFLPNDNLEPGTYRIVHDETGKSLRIHDEDEQRLIIWGDQTQGSDRHETKMDHWFLLRSGNGYIFKHCQRGTYISISFKSNYPYPILATPLPTTWVVYTKEGSAKLECVIATDRTLSRVMSLDSGSNSAGANGDRLHLTRLYKDDDECWRLERIGSDVGEGAEGEQMRLLRRELKIVKTELVEDKSKLKIVEEQLAAKLAELADVQSELSRKAAELEEQQEALDQAIGDLSAVAQEISEKDTKIAEKDRAIAERDKTIHMKDAELAEKDRMIAELDLDELTWSSIGQPPMITAQSSPYQGTSTNITLSSSDTTEKVLGATTPKTTKKAVRSKPRPVSTALDVRLSEMGWISDSD